MPAYRVEVENTPCDLCGHGDTWNVVHPDGSFEDGSYSNKHDALDLCDAMNRAYELGREAGHSELPEKSKLELREWYQAELRKDAEMPEHIAVFKQIGPNALESLMLVEVQRMQDERGKLLRITVA